MARVAMGVMCAMLLGVGQYLITYICSKDFWALGCALHLGCHGCLLSISVWVPDHAAWPGTLSQSLSIWNHGSVAGVCAVPSHRPTPSLNPTLPCLGSPPFLQRVECCHAGHGHDAGRAPVRLRLCPERRQWRHQGQGDLPGAWRGPVSEAVAAWLCTGFGGCPRTSASKGGGCGKGKCR